MNKQSAVKPYGRGKGTTGGERRLVITVPLQAGLLVISHIGMTAVEQPVGSLVDCA